MTELAFDATVSGGILSVGRDRDETIGVPGVGPHHLKRSDITERFARRTHTLTGGAAFNTDEPARARKA